MGHKLVQSMAKELWKNDLFKFDFRETISFMGHKLVQSMAKEL